jgi:hypothetical protein
MSLIYEANKQKKRKTSERSRIINSHLLETSRNSETDGGAPFGRASLFSTISFFPFLLH